MKRSLVWSVLLTLALAGAAFGVTWLNDDLGRSAGLCSFLNASGIPVACSSTNPLPVNAGAASASPVSGPADQIGYGRIWYTSQGAVNTVVNRATSCLFEDDTTVQCLQHTGGNTANLVRSTNAGRTFEAVQVLNPAFPAGINDTGNLLKMANGTYLIMAQDNAATPILRSVDLVRYTQTTTGIPTGAGSQTVWGVMSPGGTVIVAFWTGAGNTGQMCRSTNNGGSFVCQNPANYDSPRRTQPITWASGTIFLALDNTANNANIIRSTDDGVTWTFVRQINATTAGGALSTSAIKCEDAGTGKCLAAVDNAIWYSTDSGATWTRVFDGITNSDEWQVVVSFGSDRWSVLSNEVGIDTSAGIPSLYTNDPAGSLFRRIQQIGPYVAGALISYPTVISRGGNAVVWPNAGGSTVGAYSPTVGANEQFIVGSNGLRGGVSDGGVFLGTLVQSRGYQGVNTVPQNFNQQVTGAANTAVVLTITASRCCRPVLYTVSARCSAGTSSLTVAFGGTTWWSTAATEIGTTTFRFNWLPGLTGSAVNQAATVTLATCGVGNTGTVAMQADRIEEWAAR